MEHSYYSSSSYFFMNIWIWAVVLIVAVWAVDWGQIPPSNKLSTLSTARKNQTSRSSIQSDRRNNISSGKVYNSTIQTFIDYFLSAKRSMLFLAELITEFRIHSLSSVSSSRHLFVDLIAIAYCLLSFTIESLVTSSVSCLRL